MSKKAEAEITQPGVFGKNGEYGVGETVEFTPTKDGQLPGYLRGKAQIIGNEKSAVTNPKKPNKADMLNALKEADISVDKSAKVPEIRELYDALLEEQNEQGGSDNTQGAE